MSGKQGLENHRNRVSLVVINEGKILGFNAEDPFDKSHYVFLPGGKIEPGETPQETARRETLEETGYEVSVDANESIFRKYDFYWNGQYHICHTTYFLGQLNHLLPRLVEDASYHRGVIWTPLNAVDEVFGYHPDILEPIHRLMDIASRKR